KTKLRARKIGKTRARYDEIDASGMQCGRQDWLGSLRKRIAARRGDARIESGIHRDAYDDRGRRLVLSAQHRPRHRDAMTGVGVRDTVNFLGRIGAPSRRRSDAGEHQADDEPGRIHEPATGNHATASSTTRKPTVAPSARISPGPAL